MSQKHNNLLGHIEKLLQYHAVSGFDVYPYSDDTRRFLQLQPAMLRAQVCQGKQGSATDPQQPAGKSKAVVQQQSTIAEIAEEIKVCRSCDLINKRIVPVSGHGGRKAKLLVIGGWLGAADADLGRLSGTSTFGPEEDLMLSRMFKAINLEDENTFVTNIIKCGIGENVQPMAENIDACVSYLHRQIAAIAPQIICTMGILATRTLLQQSKPLSQLRGRFHKYSLNQEKAALVMPTYHPSFLLKNPEMKMATWSDLQMIDKELQAFASRRGQ